jgi:DNA-binding transcriptional LysR family regulator
MLTHDDLALVLAIADSGRMKGAAERLRTHPATVYRRLEALEHRLGGRLFERLGGKLVATAPAEEIIAAAREVAGRLDALNRQVAGRDGRLSGTLSVTTTDTLQALAMPVLAAFGRTHPALDLRVGIANTMADLGRNEADIAIRPTRAPGEALVGSQIGGFDYAVYTGAERALPAPLPMLTASAGWIAYGGAIAQAPAARWLAENVPAGNCLVTADAMLAAALAARSGAYALLPSYLGDDPVFGLARVSPPIAQLRSQVWLLTHPDLRHAAKVRAFMDVGGKALRKALRSG